MTLIVTSTNSPHYFSEHIEITYENLNFDFRV